MNGININQSNFTVRAYADDTYIGGTGTNDWSTLQLWIDRHFIAANGQVNWTKTTYYLLSPSSTPPSTPFPAAATLPLKTLGVYLPITPENSAALWETLFQKAKRKAASLMERNLTLKGRILVLKTLILSLVWYHAAVSPPPPDIIKKLQSLVSQFVWKGRHYHPKAEIASLKVNDGGINLPLIRVETEIRLAKTISQAFAPHTPFWVQVSNDTLHSLTTIRDIAQAITQKRSTHKPLEPIRSCLSACRKIERKQPTTMATLPSLPTLRNILRPDAPAQPETLTLPNVGQISWEEIFHKHRHRPASDILWLATWDRLPVGQPIATIALDSSSCPWCPNEENSTSHLFHHCHIAQMVWDATQMVFTYGAHSQPPPNLPSPSLSPQQHRLLRSTQSAAISILWNAFSSRAFGRNPTPSPTEITNQLIGRLLSLRALDLQIDPTTPWVSPSQLNSIINIAKHRHTPPS